MVGEAIALSKAVLGTVTLTPPAGTSSTWTTQVSPGKDYLIVGAGFSPFVRIETPLDMTTAAVELARSLLAQEDVEPDEVTDFALASSVPGRDTFTATTVANRLGLGAPNPTHVDTLCTSGATAMSGVIRALVERDGEGIALVIGADHQGSSEIVLDEAFREVLAEVTGQHLPMQFALSPHALKEGHPFGSKRFEITKEDFLEAVALFVERYGRLPECVHDRIVQSFLDPATDQHMWDTAATVAHGYDCSTAQAVQIGLQSHCRYTRASDTGILDGVMIPGVGQKSWDENALRTPDANAMGKGETAPGVTSKTSSAMGGGAAGVLIASESAATKEGLPVQAKIVAYATAKGPAEVMGLGPIAATRSLLEATGLEITDIPMIQVNEAFACVVYAFLQEFFPEAAAAGVYPDHVNPYGGAIAHGHVMGATFLRMVAQATRHFELHPDQRYALVTLCGGGGQGAAMLLENPHWNPKESQPAWITEVVSALGSDEAAIYGLFRAHGYLPVEGNIEAIRRHLVAVREASAITQGDIDYVIQKNGGRTLPVAELLQQAQMVRELHEVKPGSSLTIGQRLGVIGAGEMGHQIAFDYARAGYEVTLADMSLELAGRGRDRIIDRLYEAVGRRLYTPEEAKNILARIHLTDSMAQEIKESRERPFEMVIEAATENMVIKKKIFEALNAAVAASEMDVVLATNSSSIKASDVGAQVNFHYFNPVHGMAMIDGAIPAHFSVGNHQRIEARLTRIAANTRKAFYAAGSEAPGLLTNPVFAATYFVTDLLPDLQRDLEFHGVDVDTARNQAIALLDVLYVEAIRGEPKALSEILARPLDVGEKGELARSLRRGGMGLFRLIDSTGGPLPYVETAAHVAPYYGERYGETYVLRDQLGQWQNGERDAWYPEEMDAYGYDRLVRTRAAEAMQKLGEDEVAVIRKNFHREFWASVIHLVGVMHDKQVVGDDRPDVLANAVTQGLNWTVDPETWLRAQGSRDEVVTLLEGQGWTPPAYLTKAPENLAELPTVKTVLVNYSPDGKVATITINRPRQANAVNQQVIDELSAVAEQMNGRGGVQVVVIQGQGKNFVGGADIGWFKARQDESARLRAAGDKEGALTELARIYDDFAAKEIAAMKKLGEGNRLVVAVVQGKNVGGGVEMIAQADYVIALEGMEGQGTQFWMPEASLGIGIGYGAHVELVKKVGRAHALRILLTGAGAKFGAREAAAMGFVNDVIRHDQLGIEHSLLTSLWDENLRQSNPLSKREFIDQCKERITLKETPTTKKLQAQEHLWSDPLAVKCLVLGQVPPWLTGEQKRLAEQAVAAIRHGSPEAIALLHQMVDEGEGFDLREGLVRIFDTPNARAGIGGRPGYRWPHNRIILGAIAGFAGLREAREAGGRG